MKVYFSVSLHLIVQRFKCVQWRKEDVQEQHSYCEFVCFVFVGEISDARKIQRLIIFDKTRKAFVP